jgi:phosphoribosyl-AMP cyclohydrolase
VFSCCSAKAWHKIESAGAWTVRQAGRPETGSLKMIELDFKKLNGLVPAVVQDHQTGEVLMVGFMNPDAWKATLKTGKATFYSRTRNTLWTKGLTSGNVQLVKEIRIDCDDDTVLLKVEQVGAAACHTGHRSCFFQRVRDDQTIEVMGKPLFDPKEVYKT